LKAKSESEVGPTLDLYSVVATLLWADSHESADHKAMCIDYISAHAKELKPKGGLGTAQSHLLMEIVAKMANFE